MARTLTASELFEMFVLQQQQWTMIQLGKMVNPMTGEVARDLEAARMSIDLLGMLQEKTKGNLDAGEEALLLPVHDALAARSVRGRRAGHQRSSARMPRSSGATMPYGNTSSRASRPVSSRALITSSSPACTTVSQWIMSG